MKIIINADDFGFNPFFNKGIVDSIKAGVVSSLSLMVNQEFLEIKEILEFEKVSIGLHLEIADNSSEEEIEAQIEKFKKIFGKMPSHLDGHQHCHITNLNIEKVANVASKYNLPVRSRFDEDREYFKNRGIKTPDRFISWHPNRIPILEEKLENMSEEIVEMVCHPGYYDSTTDVKYNLQREEELKYLMSDNFKQKIKKFNLISYNEI